MNTLLKISWRNIWRNKLRSLVVIGSIVVGIWAGVFTSGFSYGLNKQRTDTAISESLSHVQMHHADWQQDPNIENWLTGAEEVNKSLETDQRVKAHTSRILVNGMVASAHYTMGIQVVGINADSENKLTGLGDKLDTGEYFESDSRNPVMIGQELAKKLKVRLGSKVVITFTDPNGDIVAGAFKVKGVYSSLSSQQEKMFLYVRQEDVRKLVDVHDGVHEIALLLKNDAEVNAMAADLQEQFPELRVETWRELSPDLSFADELMTMMLYIIIGIIMLALCFGIINTMLMAVLERRKELGMLMGVGMSKTRLFFMIILETLMLALCGGPLGIFLGYLSIELAKTTGLDLSIYADGLRSYGIDTVIYPAVETSFYFGTGIIVMIVTMVAAVWPARRALKLNPAETIRTI